MTELETAIEKAKSWINSCIHYEQLGDYEMLLKLFEGKVPKKELDKSIKELSELLAKRKKELFLPQPQSPTPWKS